jgi:Retinal pigment epithelial membrane protein
LPTAYEVTDKFSNKAVSIVLDAYCHENGNIVNSEYAFAYIDKMTNKKERLKTEQMGCVTRFNLPLNAKSEKSMTKVSPIKLPTVSGDGYTEKCEYPMVSPLVYGKKHQYIYRISLGDN